MTAAEQLLDAIGEVGLDLVDMAEKVRFPKSFLRRTLPVAACMALLLGAGLYLRTWLTAPRAAELSAQTAETPASISQAYYILELPAAERTEAAVDSQGRILATAADLELITDLVTGDPVAFLANEHPGTDTDQETAERIVYDLEGQEQLRIHAKSIQVLGDVVAVEFLPHNHSLYRRDGTPIRHWFDQVVVLPDCIIGQTDIPSWVIYGPDGQAQMTLENVLQYSHWNGQTQFVKEAEGGFWGIVDFRGAWLLEPDDRTIEMLCNGCVFYRQQNDRFLSRPETGQRLSVPTDAGVEPYGDYLRWSGDSENQTVYWLTDWTGSRIIGDSQWIQWIDDEADGSPELFLAKQGDTVLCFEPDGTERLRIEEAGTITAVSSQAAVYTKTIQDHETGQWVIDFALIDLETGIGRRTFGKNYSSACVLMTHTAEGLAQLPGYFLAGYSDSNGNSCGDLLDAAGNVILENIRNWDSEYRPEDAFCTEDGYRLLDGSWLYRFES